MAANVITIARTLGSRGEEIAHAVAAELDYRYLDHAIIIRAADISGVDPAVVESAEQPKSLISRIVDAVASVAVDGEAGHGTNLPGELIYFSDTRIGAVATAATAAPRYADYESLIRSVITELADAGNAVIVAHGAGMHLAGRTDLLRVLVTASADTRVAQLIEGGGMTNDDAARSVRDSDSARRDYLRRFYDIKEEQPTHYDLVLNTDTLSLASAASLIVKAAH